MQKRRVPVRIRELHQSPVNHLHRRRTRILRQSPVSHLPRSLHPSPLPTILPLPSLSRKLPLSFLSPSTPSSQPRFQNALLNLNVPPLQSHISGPVKPARAITPCSALVPCRNSRRSLTQNPRDTRRLDRRPPLMQEDVGPEKTRGSRVEIGTRNLARVEIKT